MKIPFYVEEKRTDTAQLTIAWVDNGWNVSVNIETHQIGIQSHYIESQSHIDILINEKK